METKINLIEILKDKPLNFKLYDAVRNIDVFLDEVLENINEICCKLDEDGRQMIYYSHKGTLVDFEDGIVALVPSKGMRDWRKFLWKKGDVLVSNDGKTEIIFDKFDDDSYTMFSGKYGLDCSNGTKDERLVAYRLFQQRNRGCRQNLHQHHREKIWWQVEHGDLGN